MKLFTQEESPQPPFSSHPEDVEEDQEQEGEQNPPEEGEAEYHIEIRGGRRFVAIMLRAYLRIVEGRRM